MDARREAAALRARLEADGTPARAAGAKAYMRSDLAFTGTTVPAVRRLASAWLKANGGVDAKALRAVARALWAMPVFEARLLATVLLQRRSDLLRPVDLPWLEDLVAGCRAWALMDNLAPYAVAHALAQDPALRRRALARWARDPDFWMRRAALLTMHRDLARGGGDWPLWVHLADGQVEDDMGWRRAKPSADERFFIR